MKSAGTKASPWSCPAGGSIQTSRRMDEEAGESWWLGLDRAQFATQAKAEQARIAGSRIAHHLTPTWRDA